MLITLKNKFDNFRRSLTPGSLKLSYSTTGTPAL